MRPSSKSEIGLLNQIEGLNVLSRKDPENKKKNKRKGDEVMLWKKKAYFSISLIGSIFRHA